MHILKTLIKKTLAQFGLTIQQLTTPKTTASQTITFHQYTITTLSPELAQTYADFPQTNAVLHRLVKLAAPTKEEIIIDIGANCGDTLAIIKTANPTVQTICIEGDPTLFATLQANNSQFTDTELVQQYLGETDCTEVVSIEKAGFNNTLTHSTTTPTHEQISIAKLDTLLSHHMTKADSICLIKIDTEGYDVRILFGSQHTLQTYQPILFFEYNRLAMQACNEPGKRLFPYLHQLGYQGLAIYDPIGRLILIGDLNNIDQLYDLHSYADGKQGNIHLYYDIIVFHTKDAALATTFFDAERQSFAN